MSMEWKMLFQRAVLWNKLLMYQDMVVDTLMEELTMNGLHCMIR